MINKIILTGRLVQNPELKQTSGGINYSNFTLAVDRNYKNQEGKIETDFINIIIWRQQAERCAEYLEKGGLIGIEGSLRINKQKTEDRTYINPEVKADRVEFLDWPKK